MRRRGLLVRRLELTVIPVLVNCNERVLREDHAVSVDKLSIIGSRGLEVRSRQRTILSIGQVSYRAFLDLLAVGSNPHNLIALKWRQLASKLELCILQLLSTRWNVRGVEVGVIIRDIQLSDLLLNLGKVNVVPTLLRKGDDADCTITVRILAAVTVCRLEYRSRESAEGVENLTIILGPDVRVVSWAGANVFTHADRVATFGIGRSSNCLKDRLLSVSPHIQNHVLGCFGLLTVRQLVDSQALVLSNAFIGEHRGIDLCALNRKVTLPPVERTGLVTVRAALCIGPHSTGESVRGHPGDRLLVAFVIHREVRALHVAIVSNAGSLLAQEDSGALLVRTIKEESAICTTIMRIRPGTRNTATSLANIRQVVAGVFILQRGISPHTVLLASRCTENVRLTVHVNERVLLATNRAIRVLEDVSFCVLLTKVEGILSILSV